jgi:hypothetical protein
MSAALPGPKDVLRRVVRLLSTICDVRSPTFHQLAEQTHLKVTTVETTKLSDAIICCCRCTVSHLVTGL